MVLIPYILDILMLEALSVEVVMAEANICGAVTVDVMMAEMKS